MTTFTPQRPEDGWARRWPSEAFELMKQTPLTLLVFVVLSLASGFIIEISQKGPTEIFVQCALCVLLICPLFGWLFHSLGKHEGYVFGTFKGHEECMRMIVGPAIFVAVALSVLWFSVGLNAAQAPERPPIRLSDIFDSATSVMSMTFILSYAGMFSILAVPMVNMGKLQNEIVAKRAHAKLREVFPSVTMVAFLFDMVPMSLVPSFVHYAVQVFFLYVVYVAGREIIGGITGNKHTVTRLAPQASPT